MSNGATSSRNAEEVRPIIVTPNCSLRMGGEAALPFHFFRVLRNRGVDVRLVTHGRNRDELATAWPQEQDRIFYASDDWVHKLLYRVGHMLPNRISRATFGMVAEFYTERQQRRIIRRLVKIGRGNLVHKPIPVSPVQPSILHSVGAPVVFGPMNGGMDYPPGFRRLENPLERLAVRIGRRLGGFVNLLFPGKRRAALLLVANQRTREALPRGVDRRPIASMPENGVDLPLWNAERDPAPAAGRRDGKVRFVFLGRLVDWKAVDLLLDAWSRCGELEATLEIIGDGPMLAPLKAQCDRLGLNGSVQFAGWQPQTEAARRLAAADALVLPSLLECGGAVVLEAMAAGLPVIAARWGGPTDYLDESCGILIAPTNREQFVNEFAEAMRELGGSAGLRRHLGTAGKARVEQFYDWDRKADRILAIYQEVIAKPGSTPSLNAGKGTPA